MGEIVDDIVKDGLRPGHILGVFSAGKTGFDHAKAGAFLNRLTGGEARAIIIDARANNDLDTPCLSDLKSGDDKISTYLRRDTLYPHILSGRIAPSKMANCLGLAAHLSFIFDYVMILAPAGVRSAHLDLARIADLSLWMAGENAFADISALSAIKRRHRKFSPLWVSQGESRSAADLKYQDARRTIRDTIGGYLSFGAHLNSHNLDHGLMVLADSVHQYVPDARAA